MLLSWSFALYLLKVQPFLNSHENKMQVLNEWTYLMVSTLYYCFTDFNPSPLAKIQCGWVVILVVLINLLWPNLSTMMRGLREEIILNYRTKQAFIKKVHGRKTFEK